LGVAHWAHRATSLPTRVTPTSIRAGHLRVTAPEVDDCLLNPGLIAVHWARRIYGPRALHLSGAYCQGCTILSLRESAACQVQKWWRTDPHWARHRRCLLVATGPLIAACHRGGLPEGPRWARSLFQECLLQRGYRFCPRQVCETCRNCTKAACRTAAVQLLQRWWAARRRVAAAKKRRWLDWLNSTTASQVHQQRVSDAATRIATRWRGVLQRRYFAEATAFATAHHCDRLWALRFVSAPNKCYLCRDWVHWVTWGTYRNARCWNCHGSIDALG
jgi:hypothetical protein